MVSLCMVNQGGVLIRVHDDLDARLGMVHVSVIAGSELAGFFDGIKPGDRGQRDEKRRTEP